MKFASRMMRAVIVVLLAQKRAEIGAAHGGPQDPSLPRRPKLIDLRFLISITLVRWGARHRAPPEITAIRLDEIITVLLEAS